MGNSKTLRKRYSLRQRKSRKLTRKQNALNKRRAKTSNKRMKGWCLVNKG